MAEVWGFFSLYPGKVSITRQDHQLMSKIIGIKLATGQFPFAALHVTEAYWELQGRKQEFRENTSTYVYQDLCTFMILCK